MGWFIACKLQHPLWFGHESSARIQVNKMENCLHKLEVNFSGRREAGDYTSSACVQSQTASLEWD